MMLRSILCCLSSLSKIVQWKEANQGSSLKQVVSKHFPEDGSPYNYHCENLNPTIQICIIKLMIEIFLLGLLVWQN
jgi:hypothetical protein